MATNLGLDPRRRKGVVEMKVLILDAIRPHLNPNPEIVHSITEAFRRIGPPGDVAYATQWDFESLAASLQPELILTIASQIQGELAAPLAAIRARQKAIVGWWLTDDPYEIDGNLPRARLSTLSPATTCVPPDGMRGRRRFTFRWPPTAAGISARSAAADGDYEWDLVFCGVAFPNRLAWIEAAAPVLARYKTLIVGPGWPSFRFTSEPPPRQRRTDGPL